MVCLLGIVFVLMTAPVSASTLGYASVVGSVPASVSISIVNPSQTLTLTPGSAATSNTAGLDVSSTDYQGFSITVADNTGRVASYQGLMGNYTNGAYVSYPLNTILSLPIQVTGGDNPGSSYTATGLAGAICGENVTTSGGSIESPSGMYLNPITAAGQTIYQGSGSGQSVLNGVVLPVSFSETMATNQNTGTVPETDMVVLPTNNNYRIDLVFTITGN
jgi:hypothetical protein